ncbi:MAG: sulfotransferase [Parafilimonas sp.]
MSNFLSKNEKLLEKPIIIFGTGRSGTTIISDIIFQHEDLAWHSNYQELFPKFAGVNYLRRLFDNKMWRLIGMNTQNNKSFFNYVCFRPIERYNFWQALTGPRIEFARNFLIDEKATAEEKKNIRTFFAKMVKYQKRKRLAFKITGPSRMEYLSSIFPDALFVNIVREPVATVRSWLEVQWSNQITDQLWWTGAYSPAEEAQAKELSGNPALFAAFQYKKIMETTDDEIKKVNPNICVISYEEFVNDPNGVVAKLMNFLKLNPSKLIDEYMTKISVKNRNDRQAKSSKTNISEEIKKQILQIVNT